MERNMLNFVYEPEKWEEVYKQEKINLQFILGDLKVLVEHIGATSMPACHTSKNLDILISVNDLIDLPTIQNLLVNREYRVVPQYSEDDCVVLVKKTKVLGMGITLRIMQYASQKYNEYKAFRTYLLEDRDRIRAYNRFRQELLRKCGKDFETYRLTKKSYMDGIVKENFRFE